MRILRNVFRRKLRVLLTIFGITIGVLALVVMGSMAEKINLLVSGGVKYYSDKVIVSAEGSNMFSSGPLSYGKLDAIKAVPGVREVQGEIGTLLDTEASMSFGMPSLLTGSDMRGLEYESFEITFSEDIIYSGVNDREIVVRDRSGALTPGKATIKGRLNTNTSKVIRYTKLPRCIVLSVRICW